MCIGIPMRIVGAGARPWCEGRGRRERLDTILVGQPPAGTWVLAFQGSAVRILSEAEATSIDAALDALEGALDADAIFADIEQARARIDTRSP